MSNKYYLLTYLLNLRLKVVRLLAPRNRRWFIHRRSLSSSHKIQIISSVRPGCLSLETAHLFEPRLFVIVQAVSHSNRIIHLRTERLYVVDDHLQHVAKTLFLIYTE